MGFSGVASNHLLHAEAYRSLQQISADCRQEQLNEVDTAPMRHSGSEGLHLLLFRFLAMCRQHKHYGEVAAVLANIAR